MKPPTHGPGVRALREDSKTKPRCVHQLASGPYGYCNRKVSKPGHWYCRQHALLVGEDHGREYGPAHNRVTHVEEVATDG